MHEDVIVHAFFSAPNKPRHHQHKGRVGAYHWRAAESPQPEKSSLAFRVLFTQPTAEESVKDPSQTTDGETQTYGWLIRTGTAACRTRSRTCPPRSHACDPAPYTNSLHHAWVKKGEERAFR